MAVVPISVLKTYFNTGDTPTEANYVNLIDTLAALPAASSFSWINLLPESIVVGIANVDRKRDFTRSQYVSYCACV